MEEASNGRPTAGLIMMMMMTVANVLNSVVS